MSGCLFDCPGCYNLAAQNFNYGRPYTQELEDQIIADIGQSYVQGLTLLGGEPFLNTWVCNRIIDRVRAEYGHSKDIWSCFMDNLKDLTLQFRGSSNQRIIDVQKSLKTPDLHPVIWDKLQR